MGLYSLTEEQEKLVDQMEINIEANPLTSQPKYILKSKGTLRDYQLEGINWLIKQHDKGLPGILGDEMVTRSNLKCIHGWKGSWEDNPNDYSASLPQTRER